GSQPEGRVILHFDDGKDIRATRVAERLPGLVRRGMATPEHILRAGRLPLWLDLDPSAPAERLVDAVRTQLAQQRSEYEAYHRRHAAPEERPLDDWAKVVLAPGHGIITASRDKHGAVTANLCYRAVLATIANAEALAGFEFIPEAEVYAFEHWPLERRKIAEQDAREHTSRLVPRQVAVVIGGGSGIGRAAARRFAAEGAHVVVADLDHAAADAAARGLDRRVRLQGGARAGCRCGGLRRKQGRAAAGVARRRRRAGRGRYPGQRHQRGPDRDTDVPPVRRGARREERRVRRGAARGLPPAQRHGRVADPGRGRSRHRRFVGEW